MSRTWAFDVDGCLVDSLSATSLRPHARELLQALAERGDRLVLWSAGGRDHCDSAVSRHRLGGLFAATYDKSPLGPDGRLTTEHLPLAHRPDVVVDDRPEEAPPECEVRAVPPYTAHDLADRAFARLLSEVASPGRAGA